MKLPFSDDSLFFTHEFEDETSAYDPEGRWSGVCYSRTYRCRIPIAFRDCSEAIDWFIDSNLETDGFWVDACDTCGESAGIHITNDDRRVCEECLPPEDSL